MTVACWCGVEGWKTSGTAVCGCQIRFCLGEGSGSGWGKGQIFSFRALGSDCDIWTVDFAITHSLFLWAGEPDARMSGRDASALAELVADCVRAASRDARSTIIIAEPHSRPTNPWPATRVRARHAASFFFFHITRSGKSTLKIWGIAFCSLVRARLRLLARAGSPRALIARGWLAGPPGTLRSRQVPKKQTFPLIVSCAPWIIYSLSSYRIHRSLCGNDGATVITATRQYLVNHQYRHCIACFLFFFFFSSSLLQNERSQHLASLDLGTKDLPHQNPRNLVEGSSSSHLLDLRTLVRGSWRGCKCLRYLSAARKRNQGSVPAGSLRYGDFLL